MRDDQERLRDILDAINQIEKYSVQGKDKFMEDELIQTWVIHHLMIIGEASSNISQEIREKYPDIPWVGTIDVRNIITHEYFRVDLNIIWMIVEDNLPDFKKKIETIL
ncbi:DUF86 domain-containing protein [Crocosphaera sp.]|uniref:HepT-like ribonuclease domain-containing protein n=1 Tax=Crocosphaera sp. TaxID=2729996 RepID=UPI00260C9BE6|nr:DUF86 domain-containing protein [Crocosphaera sp.]MDJ0581232.1 DUF86 domain-containing protein [Crocosphaera sp.]